MVVGWYLREESEGEDDGGSRADFEDTFAKFGSTHLRCFFSDLLECVDALDDYLFGWVLFCVMCDV